MASAAPLMNAMQDKLAATLESAGLSKEAAAATAKTIAQTTALAVGTAVGGTQGGTMALNVDANNRQLHPTEIQWIKANAKRYAQQKGISEADAERKLAEQAFRQVQFGAEGGAAAWESDAQNFLRNAAPQSLAGGGFMFYATPDQKADATMYLNSAISNADFYAKNGLKQPTQTDLQNAAVRDAQIRANYGTATKTAFAASASIALAGLAPSVLRWALSHPIEATTTGIITAETAAAITSGAVSPTSLTPVLSAGGASVRVGAGAFNSSAPWLDEVANLKLGGTFLQCGNGSCVSATAQNLTGGAVTEAQMVSKIGEWSNAESLASALNQSSVNGGKWIGGMVSDTHTLALANKGIIGAELQVPGQAAHMVAIEPIPGAPGTFHVMDTGLGATYTVNSAWVLKYVSKVVAQP